MELMSIVLFCALLALLPQALGKTAQNREDIQADETIKSQAKIHKQTFWDVNASRPHSSRNSDLQAVFTDTACSSCIPCMERAIKSHKVHYQLVHSLPSTEDLNSDSLQTDYKSSIDKRDLNIVSSPEDTSPESNSQPVYKDFKLNKKLKTKKSKSPKTVSVTKYYVKDEVYALKVNELGSRTVGNSNNTITVSTCLVFSVKKSASCNSPESELLLSSAKRKAVKRIAKNKAKLTTEKSTTVMYKKREIDQSSIPETVYSFEDY